MKNKAKKKLFCGLMVFVLLLQAACSGKEDKPAKESASGGASGEPVAMGRYIEKEVALPGEMKDETVVYSTNSKEGLPVFVTKAKEGKTSRFFQYTMKEDQSFQREEMEWLNGLKIPNDSILSITLGEDGNYYVVYMAGDGKSSARVYRSGDGKTAEELKLPVLDKKDEYDEETVYWFFSGIRALENGFLMLYHNDSIYLVDGQNGKTIREIPGGNGMVVTKEAVRGNNIYQLSGKGDSIALIDGKTGETVKTLPADVSDVYGTAMAAAGEKDLVLLNRNGISLLKDGSELWETVVEGSSSTMGSPNFYGVGIMTGTDKDYFVYYSSMNSPSKLIHYVFDSGTPTEPDKTLTIYSLADNNIIRQAAVEFQTKNPSVRVDFQRMITEDSGADTSDYIRSFNTELLSGKGPDLIVLDGLPLESYIEKGVLADISDLMEPLATSGDFLPNLVQSCQTEGRLYAVPTRMRLPLAYGTKDLTAMAGDLHELAGYMEANPDQKVFGLLDQTAFVGYYFNVLYHELINEEKQIDGDALKEFLNDSKKILNAAGVSDGSDEKRPAHVWGLIEQGNGLAVDEMAGVFNGEFNLSAIRQGGFSMATVNNVWIPYGEIGINKSSQNMELAQEFLKLVFSQSVQQTDYYDGFPVSANALDAFLTTENHTADAEGGTAIGADGKEYEYNGTWPTKEQLQELIGFCKTVDRKAVLDSTLSDILIKETEGFFKGTKSLEDTCTSILNKYQTYLTE